MLSCVPANLNANLSQAVAFELAGLADLVFQSVTFAAIDAATEEGADDFTGTVAWLSRAVLREVGALPE